MTHISLPVSANLSGNPHCDKWLVTGTIITQEKREVARLTLENKA
jgi:hypothetical protein